MKTQLSLEFLVILSLVAIYLGFVAVLWQEAATKIKEKMVQIEMAELREDLEFYNSFYVQGKLERIYLAFPLAFRNNQITDCKNKSLSVEAPLKDSKCLRGWVVLKGGKAFEISSS